MTETQNPNSDENLNSTIEQHIANALEPHSPEDLHLRNLTMDVAPESLPVQEILDYHHMDAEKLLKLTDKDLPPLNLNDSQLLAVRMAVNKDRPFVCIQGPPGTGKTHTLVYLIYRIVKTKEQVVVLAPTEEGLRILKDMTEKLLKERERECRAHEHALMDINTYISLIDASEKTKNDVEQVKDAQFGEIAREDYSEISRHRLEKSLRSEVGKEILKNVKAVFSTIKGPFVDFVMKAKSFKPVMCVVDDAAQAMEMETWPAILKMRLVLAGDSKQIIALVQRKLESDMKPNQSVMERLMLQKENYSWVMLNTQYRSHAEITRWSSSCFYDFSRKSYTGVEKLVDDLKPKPTSSSKLYSPMVHIDTSGVRGDPERIRTYEILIPQVTDGEHPHSYANYGEATYAMEHYQNLLFMGVQPEQIALITPYRGQVILLGGMMEELCVKYKNMDLKNTKIETVDNVKGQEYDIVIFTSVRNNPQKNFGFASDVHRLNVAVTRAKRHFVLIGSGYMFKNNKCSKVQMLFDIIRNLKQRFHPAILIGGLPYISFEPKNNFGYNFENFMKNSNDTKMIKWCEEFIKIGRDLHGAQVDNNSFEKGGMN
ncbi:unnamed protein product [Caenorhabditis nigoni]